MAYKISPVTTYDTDDKLHYTKIGKDNKEMALVAIAAGETEQESREMAEKIVKLLNKE